MSFCNSYDLNKRFLWFGFYMHCEGLAHQLFDLRSKHKTVDGDGQFQLFQLTLEDRKDFAKFAANLRWLITDFELGDKALFAGYSDYDYTDCEFRELFDRFQRDKSDAIIALLERVGNGEALNEEELKSTMEFLRMLGGRAHANIDHGGCF